jgi:trigger factor
LKGEQILQNLQINNKMKKKLLSALLVFGMLGGLLTGCGNTTSDSSDTISTDTLLSYYDFDIDDYVTLCDYKNLSIDLEDSYEVTDDTVNAYVNMYLQYYADYTELDKTTVEDGDIVNIDYVGTIDGEEFDGGSATGTNLEIGSDSFIDGFEDGLIGKEVGDTVVLDLKFADDYWDEDKQGQDVEFTVTINSIMEEVVYTYDTLTDEYASENLGYDTAQEYIDGVKSDLESSAESQKESDIQSTLLSKLVDESEINIPDSYMTSYTEQIMSQVNTYAESLDMTMEEYVQTYEGYDTIDEFEDGLADQLTNEVQQQMVLDAIIKKEGRTITQDGYDDFVNYYLSLYGMEEDDFYKQYGSKEYVQLIYAENLLLDELTSSVTVNYVTSTETVESTEISE